MRLRLLLSAALFLVACNGGGVSAGRPCPLAELTAYVSESCAAADAVFEAFVVCCEFLRRSRPHCSRSHLPAAVAAGADEGLLRQCCVV